MFLSLILAQMALHGANSRHLLFLALALFGTVFLFFTFRKGSRSSFHPSANGLSSDQNLLHHVFNQTLGVRRITIHLAKVAPPVHLLTAAQFQKIFVINLPSRPDHRDSMYLAAALTELHIEYVNGVTEVDPKSLPPGGNEANLDPGHLGNWRAHMNVARM